MLATQRSALASGGQHSHAEHSHPHAEQPHLPGELPHTHGAEPPHAHGDEHLHGHADAGDLGYHRHGWGLRHTHGLDAIAASPPNLAVLLGLGIAGGLLPDPGALAILLAAIASGRVILGLFTVVVFSIGFASVLVIVGVVAARVGRIVLTWLEARWVAWVQVAAALVIIAVGVVLTVSAWRTLAQLS
jgi:nickel/cobalt exporter